MKRNAWHMLRDGETVTLARRLPPRMDVAVSARFPVMGRARLARQIRQDLWRMVQRQRGFSPIVTVCRYADHLEVTAGGQVDCPPLPPSFKANLFELLNDPSHRQRWIGWAGRGQS